MHKLPFCESNVQSNIGYLENKNLEKATYWFENGKKEGQRRIRGR